MTFKTSIMRIIYERYVSFSNIFVFQVVFQTLRTFHNPQENSIACECNIRPLKIITFLKSMKFREIIMLELFNNKCN